jgi:hypothetical protein
MNGVVVESVLRGRVLFASVVLCALACSAAGDGPREVQLRPADELRDGLDAHDVLADAGVEPGDAGVIPNDAAP